MEKDIIIKDIKDTLVKLEGAASLLSRTPEVVAFRRVQGARDKLMTVLRTMVEEGKVDQAEHVLEQIQSECEA